MEMQRALFLLLPMLLAGALVTADGNAADETAAERGKKLFHDTVEFQVPSCAHCHSLLPPAEDAKSEAPIGPGTSLWGTTKRAGWRNMKTFSDAGDASRYCGRVFQERKGGLSGAQRTDLLASLARHSPDESLPARKVERRPRMLKKFDGGDTQKGKQLYVRYCVGCHNDTDEAIYVPVKPGKKKKSYIARKVRGYDNKNKFKPGTMSYYTTDRLSDEDLKHLIAYLGK